MSLDDRDIQRRLKQAIDACDTSKQPSCQALFKEVFENLSYLLLAESSDTETVKLLYNFLLLPETARAGKDSNGRQILIMLVSQHENLKLISEQDKKKRGVELSKVLSNLLQLNNLQIHQSGKEVTASFLKF